MDVPLKTLILKLSPVFSGIGNKPTCFVFQKLPKIEHGGPGLGYHLYWRMYDPNPINNNVQFAHVSIVQ